MLLCIDIGNSNITLGAYDGDTLKFTARLDTDTRRTSDQYAIEIRDIVHIYEMERDTITDVIIGSVVPTVGNAIEQSVRRLFGVEPMNVGPGIKTGLNIKIDNPAQLGADLAAGAVGALAKYPAPSIVIDLGTASTITVVGPGGEFLGGAIAAGIKLTLEALTMNTSQLPAVSIEPPRHVIGTNTVDCMKSGLVIGAASMIDGMVTRIERELGCGTTVIATGGLAHDVVKYCDRKIVLDENLVLDGLQIIYEKNRKDL